MLVYAIMWPGNEPSAAVCRAIEMHDIGDSPDPWYGTPEEPTSPMFVAERPTDSTGHGASRMGGSAVSNVVGTSTHRHRGGQRRRSSRDPEPGVTSPAS